jgi:hypothetical protein
MRALLVTLLLTLAGCPTSFTGSSTTPEGPSTCQARCSTWGMELVGMVSMGDNYTDGCICAVPGKASTAMASTGAVAGAAAAVMTQQRSQQQRQ